MLDRATEAIVMGLTTAIRRMPKGFYDSFDFTRTGNNLCHSVTLGALASVVSSIKGVAYVGIDVRLNRDGLKFQPDIVGFGEDGDHAVYVDFESPNSSDARVPWKDVDAYLSWSGPKLETPYIVVTSLPDRETSTWELRWTADGYYNADHKERRSEIRANPFRYWSEAWRTAMAGWDLSTVAIININGKKVAQASL
ncbi:hypothetical protein [Magnetospirillum sp. 15-1]|uniref:hypothetical protein n=1 Tax=Magnetospirillum sp. 15-1 TaxID=1979370 RepID=UPI0011429BE9|nr:hypothetical protein [Magnetospirillum sp. 15-1]